MSENFWYDFGNEVAEPRAKPAAAYSPTAQCRVALLQLLAA